MALIKHSTSITVDTGEREQSRNVPQQPVAPPPIIELWYGDITAAGAITKEDILVLSEKPAESLVGNAAILTWAKSLIPPPPQKWFALSPALNVAAYGASGPIADIIFWNPGFGPLTPQQAAPYKTDDIFRGAQAMWGHIPKSILIPLEIGNNSFCDSTIMLQSILHSAIKLGGWRKYIPSVIKIVLNKKDAAAIAAFDAIAYNYDNLRGAANKKVGSNGPKGFPNANGRSFSYFMTESNDWMKNMFASVKAINPITEFQAFAINIYTSGYFTAMQSPLRRSLTTNAIAPLTGTAALPVYFNAGFTDLGHADYQAMIPLFATIGAGLCNIPAYHGTTFRGTGSFWTTFKPGTGQRIISYMSSADEFYGKGLPWPQKRFRDEHGRRYTTPANTTPPPWNNNIHVRTQSLTARDISPYSMHQYEREHLYDYEFIEYITSHELGGHAAGGKPVQGNLASVQIPDAIAPLL